MNIGKTIIVQKRRTIARDITATGIALHAGVPVAMTLSPAPADTGIVFRRADLGGATVMARYDAVVETRLGTVIAEGDARVGVIEHLMAALFGAQVSDLMVTLDGPEPPILDGDAHGYLRLLDDAGVIDLDAVRPVLTVLKPVTVEQGNARAALLPAERLSYYCEIAFPHPVIGHQAMDFVFSETGFRNEIAPARTFGFTRELEALNAAGLGKGASLDNTLALDDEKLINADRRRFADEFVRHKILDAVGDLALAGFALLGRFEGVKSGHAINNALLRALFADPSAYTIGPSR